MDSNQRRTISQIEKHKQALFNSETDLSLTRILNTERCQMILNYSREFRERVFPPVKTVFTFIKQVLNADKSCKKAVAGVVVEHAVTGKAAISSNTGPYCKARQRLPESAVRALVKETGTSASHYAPMKWKPYGRELKVTDGSMAKTADTEKNQHAFPQHKNQKKGAGFPLLRFLAVMSLTTGAVVDYAIGAHKGKGTGESSLLRSIFGCIEPSDILLGDRYFPNFFLMADLNRICADGIFRGQSQRLYDFRKGERLGKNDHIILWKKPCKPDWMDAKHYASYPEEILIREFKVDGKVYVTTFLKSKKYHRKELAEIYERRWEVEINLKSIKEIMSMDMLSCKTPSMVRKEIGIHFLAYNFIRIMMAEACAKHGAIPWKISFKGSVQLIHEFMPYFLNSSAAKNKKLYAELLGLIVKNKVGHRPGRVEPRMVKQRPKPFPTLKRKRGDERNKLMKRIKRMISKNAGA